MISFDNTESAFEYRNDKELKKARFLFSSMGKPWLVKMGLNVTPVAIRLHIPFTKKIIRSTIFSQFVGGETLEETAAVAQKLGQYHVDVILDYGVEGGDDGEAGFNHATEEFIKVINYAATQKNIPFMSIKVTGLVRFGLLETIDGGMARVQGTLMKRYRAVLDALTPKEQEEWKKVESRIERICAAGSEKNIGVLVDAEESWIQDPVDALTMLMADKFNKEKAIVYNTIQLYRHDRFAFLRDSYVAAEERNFILGVKLVRGAYMEKERRRAAEKITLHRYSPIKKVLTGIMMQPWNFASIILIRSPSSLPRIMKPAICSLRNCATKNYSSKPSAYSFFAALRHER